MFETILLETELSISRVLICMGVALALGLLVSIIYILSDKKKGYSTNFAITLVILPAIVAIVIMLVGSNVARAFSVAGAFTLVRFRSVPGDSKDIASVFFSMAIGLAAGMGYITLAIVIAAVIGVVYLILMRSPYGKRSSVHKQLRITIPENLNYEGTFDDIFEEYTTRISLDRVKTTNLGALYELTYSVSIKDNVSQKDFIDKLRCRNGNLNIILGMMPDKQQEL